MQHAAGDRGAGGTEGREPQSAGEPAGGGGEPPGVRERQRGAGEERHRAQNAGEDRAGAERGTGTTATVKTYHEFCFYILCFKVVF